MRTIIVSIMIPGAKNGARVGLRVAISCQKVKRVQPRLLGTLADRKGTWRMPSALDERLSIMK
jgi:hypothetical protein